jgi:hypothetical protein
MPTFFATGSDVDDYWLVDGSKDFSILPANTITGWTIDLPIRMHVGRYESHGHIHMERHRDQFRDRMKRTIPELVHYKLGHGAAIFDTDKDVKKLFQFGTKFEAFLFVERRYAKLPSGALDEYLSMVSFYPPRPNQKRDPNDAIARYDSANLRLCQVQTKAAAQAAALQAAQDQVEDDAQAPVDAADPKTEA